MVSLYHVRSSAPRPGSRCLRFRNNYMGRSCLFAAPNMVTSLHDWLTRIIRSSKSDVTNIEWTDTKVIVSHKAEFNINEFNAWLNKLRAHIYEFDFDTKWNRHPTKDCYFTYANVRYIGIAKEVTVDEIIEQREFLFSGE